MCPSPPADKTLRISSLPRRAGITFAEMMIATAITSIIAVTVSGLATSVQSGTDYHRKVGTATQHARVVLDRLQRTMRSAYANERFPGFLSVSTTVGSNTYPDAVVVWTPANGTPTNTSSTGLPLYKELTVFCPSASNPSTLVEITRPNDATLAPDPSSTSSWTTALNTFRNSNDSTVRSLTSMLRTASAATNQTRGCVRFEVQSRPSKAQLDAYRNLSSTNRTYTNWRNVEWPQDFYTRNSGTRQAWCRIELQLMPDTNWTTIDPAGNTAIPFFGSATLYYEIPR